MAETITRGPSTTDLLALAVPPATTANMNAGHGKAGRHPTRAFLDALSGHDDPGMFGRMFPHLPPLFVPDDKLQALAEAMKDAVAQVPAPDAQHPSAGDNPHVPAGFTYLGQFVDHDITLDLTSLSEKQVDPLATENFRTPGLDLDSIYGRGPDGSPQLYARDPAKGNATGPKLLIGKTIQAANGGGGVTITPRNDLPRSPEGQALIGDHRNDENLLVAQTHLAFLKFHNKVVDMLAAGPNPPADLFAEARQTVTWHYQWLVLHDFVERITEDGIIDRLLHRGRKFYRFKKVPYMPVEFSAAAYRLGHSMVREEYSHNRIFTRGGAVPASLDLLFRFSGLSGQIIGELAPDPLTGPLPIPVLTSNWIIDWRRFYDFGTAAAPGFLFNHARLLDPFITPKLHTLPGGGGNLAHRNLQRGVMLGLPSGQSVAQEMDIHNPLTEAEIASGPDGAVAAQHGLHRDTPLWYYILKEAQVRKDGKRLGPVGSRIVAEVFLGLVHGDHASYLWRKGKDWKPTLPSKVPGTFTMVDLLQLVGDISPIDGITTV